ncbi:MAG: hypothetical protein WD468_11945 [Pirellulales bacterium]
MKHSAIRTVVSVAIVIGVAGCQSGPRWAWWKHDKASDDASLVARSAAPPVTATASADPKTAPALPSTQVTPQAVAMGGISPSSMNLANAANPGAVMTTTPANAIPPTSSATLAAAPTATFPGAPMTGATPFATAASPTPTAVASAPAPVVAPAGPYNPNAYQSIAPLASTAPITNAAGDNPSVDRYGSASQNRYGSLPATTQSEPAAAAPAADRYGVLANNYQTGQSVPPANATMANSASSAVAASNTASVGPIAPSSVDHYGLPTSDRYGNTSTSSVTPQQTASAPPAATALATTASPSAEASNPVTTVPTTPGTIQLTSAPGNYRPGGTSSYLASPIEAPIEVATRPLAPAATFPSTSNVPNTAAAPAAGNWPTVPMVPTVPAGPLGTGTRY